MTRSHYVLIVEDNVPARKLFAACVREAGVTSVLAGTAQEALEMVQLHGAPQLILMDVMLPGMTGLELTRTFREMPELAATRIVGVSALGFRSDRQAALEAGMDEYWTKPTSSIAVIAQIKEWFGNQEAAG